MIDAWPTKADDLALANEVIKKHIDMNLGEPLGLVEVVMKDENDVVDFRVADWIQELTDLYQDQYGEELGDRITSYVVCRCMTQGETLH